MTFEKVGRDSAKPGVSAHPGCIESKRTPARRRDHSRMSDTWARLARA